ncbi:hypothetical protein J3F83DRAFT_766598 [Trichoderma novae-zelandiae]
MTIYQGTRTVGQGREKRRLLFFCVQAAVIILRFSKRNLFIIGMTQIDKADNTILRCDFSAYDLRRVNTKMQLDAYALPKQDDILFSLQGCSVFTVMDMKKAFFQEPIKDEDRWKTSFITQHCGHEGMLPITDKKFRTALWLRLREDV